VSWDGLIFRTPEVRSVHDLPRDYVLPPFGTVDEIGAVLRRLFPNHSHHPGQCCIEGEGFWLELNFGHPKEPPIHTSIGVRSNAGLGVLPVLREVCTAFNARLFDNQTGDFADWEAGTASSMQSFAEWRDRNLPRHDSTSLD
jgi:hypothetical protein